MKTKRHQWEKDTRLSLSERATLTTLQTRGKIEDLGHLNRLVGLGYIYKTISSKNVLNYKINFDPSKNF